MLTLCQIADSLAGLAPTYIRKRVNQKGKVQTYFDFFIKYEKLKREHLLVRGQLKL